MITLIPLSAAVFAGWAGIPTLSFSPTSLLDPLLAAHSQPPLQSLKFPLATLRDPNAAAPQILQFKTLLVSLSQLSPALSRLGPAVTLSHFSLALDSALPPSSPEDSMMHMSISESDDMEVDDMLASPDSLASDLETAETLTEEPSEGNESPSTPTLSRPSIPTLVAVLELRHADPNKEFFSLEFPPTLEGLLPNWVFRDRIESLNLKLAQRRTLRDYSPLARSILLLIFVLFTIGLAAFGLNNPNSIGIWIVAFGATLGIIIYTYSASLAYTRTVNQMLFKFNDQDAQIQLKWRLSKHEEPPFFTTSWNSEGSQVPRNIEITYTFLDEQIEFLPAYTTDESSCLLDMWGEEGGCAEVEMARCPTYRTYAPVLAVSE
ncbi:hypothetical protein HDU98_011410 [Podochytrium sp. JEL0797]|nr:hypothetical protein HDU98_011410 [Podochytrium sp. JEL0797]